MHKRFDFMADILNTFALSKMVAKTQYKNVGLQPASVLDDSTCLTDKKGGEA